MGFSMRVRYRYGRSFAGARSTHVFAGTVGAGVLAEVWVAMGDDRVQRQETIAHNFDATTSREV